MDEKIFNLEIRKFLKNFGITAQTEIEKKVREALANGSIKEKESPVFAGLSVSGVLHSAQILICGLKVFKSY